MSDAIHMSVEAPGSPNFVSQVESALKGFMSTPPQDVLCTMGIVVGPAGVHMHIVGNDEQIAKMLGAMAHTVREAMQQMNNPPDHSNEVKH